MEGYKALPGALCALLSLAGCGFERPAQPAPDPSAAASREWDLPTRLRSCALCAAPSVDPTLEVTHGPLVGAVSDEDATLWARFSRSATFAVAYWPLGATQAARRCSDAGTATVESDHTAVVTLRDLEPHTTYEYELLASTDAEGACATPLSIRGQLTTLPAARRPGAVRFVSGADVSESAMPGFDDIRELAPSFVLLIGDNPYADSAEIDDYEGYRAIYHDVWSAPQFAQLFAETPLFMIWDDHEIMQNYWKGMDDARYAMARTLYDQYQGSHNPKPVHEGEIYYSFEAADIGFFVLDTRTHRSDNLAPDDEHKSMLGARQKQALEAWLVDNRYAVHVIVSSVLFADYSTTGHDSWSSFSTEREDVFDILAETGTKNAFVISGDQHWSAVIRNAHGDLDPYTLYEFQATPLASGERPAPLRRDAGLLALDNTHNCFAVFDVDTMSDPVELTYTLCAVGAPCRPGEEGFPISPTDLAMTELPYTLRFRGSAHGFELMTP